MNEVLYRKKSRQVLNLGLSYYKTSIFIRRKKNRHLCFLSIHYKGLVELSAWLESDRYSHCIRMKVCIKAGSVWLAYELDN